MRRIFFATACISALAIAGAASAQNAADPAAEQLVCDMTGDCGDGNQTAAAAAVPAGDAPAASHPRVSATRGFSFNRAASGAPATAGRPVQAPAPALRRPAQIGTVDMHLTFVTGSAILTDPARERLKRYAAALADPRLANRRVRIEGYTDANGSAQANLALSKRRAQAAADFLVTAGLPARRFDVVGLGSTRPLPGRPATDPENRRVVAVLL